MNKFILKLFFFFSILLVFIDCKYQKNSNSNQNNNYCDKLSFDLSIWNDNNYKNLIGEPEDSEPGYRMAYNWSNQGPYTPKFFDIKYEIYNNNFIQNNKNDIEYFFEIETSMIIKSGFDNRGNYLLNPTNSEKIFIDKSKIMTTDFKNGVLEYTVKNVNLEKNIPKVGILNQIIFLIDIKEAENVCKYEYSFILNNTLPICVD